MSQYYHVVHHRNRHYIAHALEAIVGVLGGLIVLLLAARFVLSLLEVDRLQPLTNVIYDLSYPFVAPFFVLFNYQQQMGVLRFEFHTLLAIVFWTLVTWFIARSVSVVTEDT